MRIASPSWHLVLDLPAASYGSVPRFNNPYPGLVRNQEKEQTAKAFNPHARASVERWAALHFRLGNQRHYIFDLEIIGILVDHLVDCIAQ